MSATTVMLRQSTAERDIEVDGQEMKILRESDILAKVL